jgi:hypothetical protein
MSRSEQIPVEVPDRFKPITVVKHGHHTTRLPRKSAEVNQSLARSLGRKEETRS